MSEVSFSLKEQLVGHLGHTCLGDRMKFQKNE